MRRRSGPPGNSTVFSGNRGRTTDISAPCTASALSQPVQQFSVNAAETAVGHDEHVIAADQRPLETGDQLIEVTHGLRALAECRDRARHVPGDIRSLIHPYVIGLR